MSFPHLVCALTLNWLRQSSMLALDKRLTGPSPSSLTEVALQHSMSVTIALMSFHNSRADVRRSASVSILSDVWKKNNTSMRLKDFNNNGSLNAQRFIGISHPSTGPQWCLFPRGLLLLHLLESSSVHGWRIYFYRWTNRGHPERLPTLTSPPPATEMQTLLTIVHLYSIIILAS